ncbi:hypothetical protein RHT_00465 [Candidatus Rhabdochlamydia sp. T3358]|nr:hypothetical protein RHT_00465 [Candidatus Rhabdochlamydia sp. T3358]
MEKLVELYCSVDDFWKDFNKQWEQHLITKGKSLRSPKAEMSIPEMMTISILFHQSKQENKSFFKKNEALFQKITNIFQEIDLSVVQKRTVCQHFMFCSITGTVLIKLGRFLKVASDANWADGVIINQFIGNPYLIMGLGGLAAVYAVKNALNLIAHRNDKAKKVKLLKNFVKDERKNLLELLKKEIVVA